MMNQDWERFGEDIRRTVQNAVDSQDYNKLNQTISNTINNAMDGLGKGMHNVGDAVDKTARNFKNQAAQNWNGYSQKNRTGNQYQNTNQYQYSNQYENAGPFQKKGQYQNAYKAGQNSPVAWKNSSLYARTTGIKACGIVLSAVGYTLSGIMFLSLLIVVIAGAFTGLEQVGFQITAGILGGLLIVGAVMGGFGTKMLGKVKRFRTYVELLEQKEYCEIKQLAVRLRKSPRFVLKDVEQMMRRGWFRQGHMDQQKTCLIASFEAYDQYQNLMRRMEEQKREEEMAKQQQTTTEENGDPRVKDILKTGAAYIRKIRECNDAIPGADISAKISRMETLVERIFERVGQSPENIPDIRRLMEYYLPTTVKLLEAYEELDAQPVQGENIISSKKEIEKTLDTLNTAFEKLLDGLFQDTAWNVSADISVLETMLAQEGLGKEDFKKGK